METVPTGQARALGFAALAAAAFAAGAFALWHLARRVGDLTARAATNEAVLQEILGEVTRLRLERSASALGPAGLLEKLRTYAPLVASSRVPEPDYRAAKHEIDAILRAFKAIGEDAWSPITQRLREVSPEQDFDEARYLMRAAVAVDEKAGKEIVRDVLAGTRLPSPRLRWEAARLMTEIDRPLAQQMLRHIMRTESSRGLDPNRPGNVPVPDPAALSATGFYNYVDLYVRTDDPQIDETLLMVLGRVEHDITTVQYCVKALGDRRYGPAVGAIEKLYRNPPNNVENPLFLTHCLTALNEIQGAGARPFLEEAMRTTTNKSIAAHCQRLLDNGG
jgi:hypothetical protein